MWGEAPANDTATKFGAGVDVQGIITHAKVKGENLKGSDFTGGRILAFSIDFAYRMGLITLPHYRAACDDRRSR